MTNRDPHLPCSEARREVDPDWRRRAACRGLNPNLFFPGQGEDSQAAKNVCADCPVREPCLGYAMKVYDPGVWGGKSEKERDRMRGRRR